MGNWLRHKLTKICASDNWDSLVSSKSHSTESIDHDYEVAKNTDGSTEKLKRLAQMRASDWSSSSSGDYYKSRGISREVKIRVSKKELEKLMGVQGLSVEQVLSHLLINGGDHRDLGPQLEHERSWRPVLQSIPEVD